MSKQYNVMHEKLVKSNKDFSGMIAYAIYKAEKRDAIKSGIEVSNFTQIALQPKAIKKYKKEAEDLVNLLLQAAADEKITKVKEELASKITKLTVESLPKDAWYKPVIKWHNSGTTGVVGNFWTAVILAFFVFLFSDANSWDAAKSNAQLKAVQTLNGIVGQGVGAPNSQALPTN